MVLSVLALSRLSIVPASVDAWQGQHVIIIGVDGLSVDTVSTAPVPRLRGLILRSAWTLEARGVMPTLSSPNWASAINGAAPEQHGTTSNGWLLHKVELQSTCRAEDGKFPTIFGLLRSGYPASRIAVFQDWPGFSDLLENQVPDILRHEPGAARTTEAAIRYWKENRPALMFIHLDNVVHAGHSHGWYSKVYFKAVEVADGYIGQVIEMIDGLPVRDSTFILVTSDHGGTSYGHGKNSLAEILIPWILAGPGVAPGLIIAPVNTFYTALTVAWIFHLGPPQCWIGRPVLAVFRQSSTLAHAGASRPAAPPECGQDRQLPSVVVTRLPGTKGAGGVPAGQIH
jgi:predicted AlkP superfamily pyrophosphatase or phosphodiesterase